MVSKDKTVKKFYITTAIPYINAAPHIGHGLDFTLADSLARYYKQQGREVFFQTGADEHGTKIYQKAKENNKSPQEYVDSIVPLWQDFLQKLGVEATGFIRTTSPQHEQAAKLMWTQLKDHIYKGTYEGWYCVGCESFVTDQQAAANNGVCPDHKTPYQKLSEENYYFKLSAFGEQIRQALVAGEFKIVPEFRQKEIMHLIQDGLNDISISRPKKQLTWGIPVPGDDDQVMYVWFEALMNYITVLGYPDTENFKKFWPADVWVGGKDILRFHAAIFPAMLIALGLPLQKTLLVHGHVLSSGAKMSKTVGNVVAPLDIINTYGVDAFRYYFLRHIPTIDDGDFTWEKFENAYNNELGNELGNLVQRVAAMVNRYQQGVIGDLPRPEHDSRLYHEEIANLRIDRAIDAVWLMVRNLNIYLEEVKPWEIAKKPEEAEHLQEILAYAAGSLQQIADLLAPFLPTTAKTITHIFEGGTVKTYSGVLFPKIYQHTQDPRTAPKKPETPPKTDAAR
ncbi:MAG TPA: methionine--tRNA ligase [Candidatus Saccharimonadales bacterium]|nr:methionine--tRNA ligase [Candidatus Saccharimonadales bacterium]